MGSIFNIIEIVIIVKRKRIGVHPVLEAGCGHDMKKYPKKRNQRRYGRPIKRSSDYFQKFFNT